MNSLLMFLLPFLFFENISSNETIPVLLSNRTFPKDFMFGVSTSAYQIEGAWNKSGKAPSIWDYLTHDFPFLLDGADGDVACDSYNKLDEDIKMLKYLGVNVYRFSISWSRIIPKGGIDDGINQEAVKYYHDLLDKLEEAGIKAMVTLFHVDTPLDLQELGIFANTSLNSHYYDYARFAFKTFGPKVRYWNTFNEPAIFCGGLFAMMTDDFAVDPYMCMHNLVLNHAMVYRMYEREYSDKFKGDVFIVINSEWNIPKRDLDIDRKAVERKFAFEAGWSLYPLVFGDYHELLKKQVRKYTPADLPSRLPEFTEDQKKLIKGTVKIIGLNYYTPVLVKDDPDDSKDRTYEADRGVKRTFDPSWEKTYSDAVFIVPSALRNLLNHLNKTFNVPIFITENGYVDDGSTLNDERRVAFLRNMLSNVLDAIYTDGVKVLGYSVWSLMDNFEWFGTYKYKYGLYCVNFTSPSRERIARKSAETYKEIIAKKCVREKCE